MRFVVERRAPALEAHLRDRDVLGVPGAGVGDAGVEPPERLDGGGDERVRGGLVAQVGLQRHAADLGRQPLGGRRALVVVHADPGALGGERLRRRRADAARGAGDEHGAAFQTQVHGAAV